MNLGIIHYLSHDFAAAAGEFRRVLEMQPSFARGSVFLGGTLTIQERYDEANAVLEELIARAGPVPIYVWSLAVSYAHAGRTQEARELLDPINQASFPALYRAMAHHLLGESDKVFPTLEEAVAQRSDWMYSLAHQPLIRDLRGNPRFEAIVESLHLPRSG
jgi:tetratricopeptide (TPR) repeat protein